jgi:hypothetical protein
MPLYASRMEVAALTAANSLPRLPFFPMTEIFSALCIASIAPGNNFCLHC